MAGIRNLEGKKAVITGGSSGIGLETARSLMRSGCRVAISGRDKKKLERTKKKIESSCMAIPVDVSDWDQVEVFSERIIDSMGSPDIIVNSAGIVHPAPLIDMDPGMIREIIEIDLIGTANVCRAFLPHMKRGGWLVNISSGAGILGLYGYGPYSGAKFGVLGLSEALRMELRPRGIGVSVVFPPDTSTPQLEYENHHKPPELGRISGMVKPIPPSRVAESIVRGIRGGKFLVFPTSSMRSLYFFYRRFPIPIRWWIDRRIGKSRE